MSDSDYSNESEISDYDQGESPFPKIDFGIKLKPNKFPHKSEIISPVTFYKGKSKFENKNYKEYIEMDIDEFYNLPLIKYIEVLFILLYSIFYLLLVKDFLYLPI